MVLKKTDGGLVNATVLEFLSVFLLIVLSGSPVVHFEFVWIVGAILYFILSRSKNTLNDRILYQFLALTWVIFIAQYLVFKWNTFPGYVNMSAKMLYGFCVVKYVGDNFKYLYLKSIYILSLISLVCFAIYTTTGYAASLIPDANYNSIFVWGISHNSEALRNPGFAWEPGSFAGYIIMCFLLFISDLNNLYRVYKKEVILIVFAIISTFSTTGYLVAFAILTYTVYKNSNRKSYFYLMIPVLLVLGYVGYSQDFMGEKISTQLEESRDINIHGDRVDHGRFTAAVFDWYYIQKHPLIGNGLDNRTRYADHTYMAENLVGFGNGFTHSIACWGIVFMLFYISLFFRNKYLKRSEAFFITLFFILLFIGENYQHYPVFYALPLSFFFMQKPIDTI